MVGPQSHEPPRSRNAGQSLARHVDHPLSDAGKDRNDLVPGGGVEVQIPSLMLCFEPRLHTGHAYSLLADSLQQPAKQLSRGGPAKSSSTSSVFPPHPALPAFPATI